MLQPKYPELAEVRQQIRDLVAQEVSEGPFFRIIEITLDAVDAERKKSPFCLLPIWVCQAAGGHPHQAVGLAAAWHLLYVAAMLLDDIEDKELALKQWPSITKAHAVNVATALIFVSQLTLNRLDRAGVDISRARSLHELFNQLVLKMCTGQHLDLAGTSTDLDSYWEMVAAKSGVFFSLAYRTGAMLATVSSQ